MVLLYIQHEPAVLVDHSHNTSHNCHKFDPMTAVNALNSLHPWSTGTGMNPARQASMKAGLPKEVPATVVNMLCGSGLRSVAMAMQDIKCGDADVVVAGGQESMSNVRSTTCGCGVWVDGCVLLYSR